MRYFILTLLLSFTFSECDELTEMQCASNADCEWFEDIEIGDCSVFDNSEIAFDFFGAKPHGFIIS